MPITKRALHSRLPPEACDLLQALVQARVRSTGHNTVVGGDLDRIVREFRDQAARDGVEAWERASVDAVARRLGPAHRARVTFWIEAVGLLCFAGLERPCADRTLCQIAAVERVAPADPVLAQLCADARRIFGPRRNPPGPPQLPDTPSRHHVARQSYRR